MGSEKQSQLCLDRGDLGEELLVVKSCGDVQ